MFWIDFDFFCVVLQLVLANPRTCPFATLSESVATSLATMGVGTVVFVIQLPHSEHIAAAAARKVVVVHRGERMLNIMLRKVDAESLLFTVRTILGMDTNPPLAPAPAPASSSASASASSSASTSASSSASVSAPAASSIKEE